MGPAAKDYRLTVWHFQPPPPSSSTDAMIPGLLVIKISVRTEDLGPRNHGF